MKNIIFKKKNLYKFLNKEIKNKELLNNKIFKIISNIKKHGDIALYKYCNKFDNKKLSKENLVLDLKNIKIKLNKNKKRSILNSFKRISKFHNIQKSKIKSWFYKDKFCKIIGQKLTPINKVAIYIPGGKAIYPSSVLMNAIPAVIAGVKKIYMLTPALNIRKNHSLFYAAKIVGIKKIFNIGGAHGVAAFALGTKKIPKVDKITGPGNYYVNCGKKIIYGNVGIDMIAGPTEILIITDGSVSVKLVVYDAFSQAEHDERTSIVIISNDIYHLRKIRNRLFFEIEKIKRKNIVYFSIKNSTLIFVKKLKKAFKISNFLAPEHLELLIKGSRNYIKYIKNAGSVFLGKNTPESIGDYSIGCNHVLPTNRNSRFSSPLGVYDYLKFINISELTKLGVLKLGYNSVNMANIEYLDSHRTCIINRYEE